MIETLAREITMANGKRAIMLSLASGGGGRAFLTGADVTGIAVVFGGKVHFYPWHAVKDIQLEG